MYLKPALSLGILSILVGCASPGSLRQGAPALDRLTSGTPEKVVGCIGDKLEASPVAAQGRLSTRPTQTGFSISDNQQLPGLYGGAGDDTIVLVDIMKTDNGSRVLLYTHFLSGDGGMASLISPCL